MNIAERIAATCIVGGLLILTAAIIDLTYHHWQRAHAPKAKPPEQTLPQKCAVYYNDGTDRWQNCMGVGLK